MLHNGPDETHISTGFVGVFGEGREGATSLARIPRNVCARASTSWRLATSLSAPAVEQHNFFSIAEGAAHPSIMPSN